MVELGSIQNVDPRTVWPHEAVDFTPWLAENADLLGEALGGLVIEIMEREVAVGPFRLDLLGKEVVGERIVAIENQMGRTDHSHLGQLLTYAADLDAQIVVWISSGVRDEHREAIRWLNDQTVDTVAFFAVELEVWKIGESLPAPRFNVIEQPIGFQQTLAKNQSTELADWQIDFRAFNDDVIERLKKIVPNLAPRARKGAFITFPLRKGFRLATTFQRQQFEVELVIQTGDRSINEFAFDQIQRERESIENEIGQQLNWDRENHSREAVRVFVSRPGTIKSPPDELEEFKRWAVDLLPRFCDAFAPRIEEIEA